MLSLGEGAALDYFVTSLASARAAIRKGISVFLSHSSRDKRFVRALASYLTKHGIRVWLDEADLLAGEPLVDRLAGSVLKTHLLVAVLSKHSVASDWVTRELLLATTAEVNGRTIKVIPILKDDCEIPPFLCDKFHLDFRTAHSRRKNEPVLVDTLMKLFMQNYSASLKLPPGWRIEPGSGSLIDL
jgi:hypothetical protein